MVTAARLGLEQRRYRVAVAAVLASGWLIAFALPFGVDYNLDVPSQRYVIDGVNATFGSALFGNAYERFAWLGNVALPLGLWLSQRKVPARGMLLAIAAVLAAVGAGAFGWTRLGRIGGIDAMVEVGGAGYDLWVVSMFCGAAWLALLGALPRTASA